MLGSVSCFASVHASQTRIPHVGVYLLQVCLDSSPDAQFDNTAFDRRAGTLREPREEVYAG
eukprot:362716-Chlamydomonas_euryale.AAC.2